MSSSKTEDRILRHTGEGDALCHHPRRRTGYCAIPKWRHDMMSSKMATGCKVSEDGDRIYVIQDGDRM